LAVLDILSHGWWSSLNLPGLALEFLNAIVLLRRGFAAHKHSL